MKKYRFSLSVTFLLLTTIAAVGVAQITPQTPPAAQKGSIQGTVVRVGSGQGLKRARVSLRRTNQPQQQGQRGEQAEALLGMLQNLPAGQLPQQLGQIEQRVQTVVQTMTANTQAVTDDTGRFVFNGVEPGQYRVSVDREGYIRQEYGQRSYSGPGTIITVNSGQRVANIDFQMVPTGSISGRIFNEDGDPVANVAVQAQRYVYQQGKRVLQPTSQTVQTNDLGEYRIYWLSPGEYFVSATARRGQVPAVNPVVTQQVQPPRGQQAGPRGAVRGGLATPGTPVPPPFPPSPQSEEAYAPTFFPGTITPESAGPVQLAAASDIRGVDFGLRPTPTVSVRGQVLVPVSSAQAATPAPSPAGRGGVARGGQRGGQQVNVMLTRIGAARTGNQNRMNVRPDGFFEISGVIPGSYNLNAVARQDGQQFSTRLRIEVGDAGLENLSIPLKAGVAVPGKIFLDGVPPNGFLMNRLRVNLVPTEEGPMGGANVGNNQVAEDGSFTLQNVSPMEYRVRVNGLPSGAYVNAGRIGSEDALNAPFYISGDQQVTLQLQIGFSAGRVQGTVTDGRNSPYQGAMATLIPDEPRRQRLELYFSTSTDQFGKFNFDSVPPGSYKLFAWEDIPSGAHQDPDYIRRFEDRGRPVKVDPGASVDTQVPVISPRQ